MGKNQSASNLTNIIKQDANGNITFVSGSTTLMSVSSSGAITTTGNVAGTASYASNAELLDGLDSTVFTLTSSFAAQTASFTSFTSSVNTFTSSLNTFSASILTFTASQNILNGTYATTGSNTFTGIQTVNSNLIVTGSITAQTLVVQTITSSVDFVTGSTRFGSILGNTHQFTGSVSITGSMGIGVAAGTNGTKFISAGSATSFFDAAGTRGISIYPSSAGNIHQITSDYIATSYYSIAITARGTNSDLFISSSGNIGIGTTSPNRLLDVSSGGDTYLRVTGNRGNSDDLHVANVEFYNSNSTRIIAEVRAITGTGGTQSNSGQLAFYTNNAGTYAERMRITSAGNVGFGTTTPQRQFVIANSSGDGLEISNSSGYSTLLPYNRTTSAYQNLVLGEGTSKVLIGTTSDNGFNFAVGQSKHCYLGNTMQISSDDFGGTERQTAIGAATWGGDSNPVINLASVFPRLTFTSRALSILCQIITSTTSTTSCAALVLFCRTINGTWSSSIISNININGLALSSASGSGTSVTLNFGTPNYGNATFTIMNRA